MRITNQLQVLGAWQAIKKHTVVAITIIVTMASIIITIHILTFMPTDIMRGSTKPDKCCYQRRHVLKQRSPARYASQLQGDEARGRDTSAGVKFEIATRDA